MKLRLDKVRSCLLISNGMQQKPEGQPQQLSSDM